MHSWKVPDQGNPKATHSIKYCSAATGGKALTPNWMKKLTYNQNCFVLFWFFLGGGVTKKSKFLLQYLLFLVSTHYYEK